MAKKSGQLKCRRRGEGKTKGSPLVVVYNLKVHNESGARMVQ